MNNETEEIINPLLININSKIDITQYKKIYFLIKKNNNIIPFDFYKLNINKELYDNISKDLILYEIDRINYNQKINNNILLLSKKNIENFNIFNYELEDINILIPIFNISFLNLLSYLNQYNNNNTLKDLFDTIILNKYFNNNNNKIENNILNLKESNYWNNEENLLLNLTNKFKNIHFIFNSKRLTDNNISKLFNYNHDIYFLHDNTKKYTDISSIINNDNIYKITNNNYTINDINTIMRDTLYGNDSHLSHDYFHELFLNQNSILWNRIYSTELSTQSNLIADKNLDKILAIYDIEHIVIGHTPQENGIKKRFNGKVLCIDTGMSEAFGKKKSKNERINYMKIENNTCYTY